MPFYQSGHVDAVALNYNGTAMAPLLSVSRSYSSANSNARSSTPKSNSLRSTTISSTHDRPTYSHRSSTLSDYPKSSYNSLTRLATSTYSDRYILTPGSDNGSCGRSAIASSNSKLSTGIDLSKYSPHNYVPNIQRGNFGNNISSNGSTATSSTGSRSSITDLLGGDELSSERQHRESSILSSPNTSSSFFSGLLWTQKPQRRCTVIYANDEVTIDQRNNNNNVDNRLASSLESTITTVIVQAAEAVVPLCRSADNNSNSIRCNNDSDLVDINENCDCKLTDYDLTKELKTLLLSPPQQQQRKESSTSCGKTTGNKNQLQGTRDESCGLNGLRNIGNTCFMNSVIQCLSNTRPLLEYLLKEHYLADINMTTSSMKGALIKAFSQVIHELWDHESDSVVNTTSLKSQIQRFAPRFMGYSQQDAQEFLRYLLEGLHEDVNRVTVKPQSIHTDIPDSYSDSMKAAESWKRYLRNEDSTIVDIFVGQLRSSLRCTVCDHVSVTLDPFWDLSLPIPIRSGAVRLNQCLQHFTREEVLDGEEKPTCSKCQMRRKCTKSFSVQKFPKILVIHLKRFSPMERFRGKLNVLVDFPLTDLELSAFAAPGVQGFTYNLYGVANHSGTTHSGHYTAYCKHPYSGQWHEYNDSRVSRISTHSVITCEGYVLFYEQQSHNSHL